MLSYYITIGCFPNHPLSGMVDKFKITQVNLLQDSAEQKLLKSIRF